MLNWARSSGDRNCEAEDATLILQKGKPRHTEVQVSQHLSGELDFDSHSNECWSVFLIDVQPYHLKNKKKNLKAHVWLC